MANKVLSIKMDEKDIERLKKYYEALVKAGFLSKKTTSLNAFYKHLLLDYLEDDISRAFVSYSEFGASPKYINPDMMDENSNFHLTNTYELNEEMFEIYKKCVKELLGKGMEEMNESAALLNEVVQSEIIVNEGLISVLECISWQDEDEKADSFWGEKAFETMDSRDKDFVEREVKADIDMIKKSGIEEELKQKLIDEITTNYQRRKQNYSMVQGRRNHE